MQRTFNRMVIHMLRQQCRSLNKDGDPAYRGLGGKMCPVGHLIPQSMFRQEMEGKPADAPAVAKVLQDLGHDVKLCWVVQKVHDSTLPAEWPTKLAKVAKRFSLSDAVLKDVAKPKV